jgi:hypothetical protein
MEKCHFWLARKWSLQEWPLLVSILVWKTIVVTGAIVLERNYSSQQTEGNKRGQQGEYLHFTQLLNWSWD